MHGGPRGARGRKGTERPRAGSSRLGLETGALVLGKIGTCPGVSFNATLIISHTIPSHKDIQIHSQNGYNRYLFCYNYYFYLCRSDILLLICNVYYKYHLKLGSFSASSMYQNIFKWNASQSERVQSAGVCSVPS